MSTATPIIVSPYIGSLIFNLSSTSQVLTPTKFQRNGGSTGGGNGNTACVLSTQALTGTLLKWGTVFRITATALAGGAFFQIDPNVLAAAISGGLPAHYIVVMELVQASTASLIHGPLLFGRVSAGDFEACMLENTFNSATRSIRPIVNDQVGATAEALGNNGTYGAGSADRMGVVGQTEVWRQAGAATALAVARCENRNGDAGTAGVGFDGAAITAIAAVGANWDGLDMSAVGFFCHENVNNTSGTIDFKRFQIYSAPTFGP